MARGEEAFKSGTRAAADEVTSLLIERNQVYGWAFMDMPKHMVLIWGDKIPTEMAGIAFKMAETIQIFHRIAADPTKRDSFLDWCGWARLALQEQDIIREELIGHGKGSAKTV